MEIIVPHPWKLDPRNWHWKDNFEKDGFKVNVFDTEYLRTKDTEIAVKAHTDRQSLLLGYDFENFYTNEFDPEIYNLIVIMRKQISDPQFTQMHREHLSICLRIAFSHIYLKSISFNPSITLGIEIYGGFASLLLSAIHGIPYFYDAQEVFSESIPGLTYQEKLMWNYIEQIIGKFSNLNITVSPGIANWYELNCKMDCVVIPNWEPISTRAGISVSIMKYKRKVEFVFYGRYAERRGIDNLISIWPADSNFFLNIYCPNLPQWLISKASKIPTFTFIIRWMRKMRLKHSNNMT